jgi:hypothetical protein
MKKHSFLLFVFLTLAFSGLFVSCESDDFYDNDPTDNRNEYVGVWRFTESGYQKSGLSQSYIVSISKDPSNSSQVLLDNFGNPGDSDNSVIGIVTINQIVVSSQTLTNGWVVEGTGKKDGQGNMEWTYSIIAGGDKDYFTATAVKQ